MATRLFGNSRNIMLTTNIIQHNSKKMSFANPPGIAVKFSILGREKYKKMAAPNKTIRKPNAHRWFMNILLMKMHPFFCKMEHA